jgi:hypothetical protein
VGPSTVAVYLVRPMSYSKPSINGDTRLNVIL